MHRQCLKSLSGKKRSGFARERALHRQDSSCSDHNSTPVIALIFPYCRYESVEEVEEEVSDEEEVDDAPAKKRRTKKWKGECCVFCKSFCSRSKGSCCCLILFNKLSNTMFCL
jgi:hypothetical protein